MFSFRQIAGAGTLFAITVFGATNTGLAQDPAQKGSKPYRETLARFNGENGLGTRKIIGGEDAKWEANRWQAALLIASIQNAREAQFCGGSIVGSHWIVTAAHCLEGTPPENVDVLTGAADLNGGGSRVKAERVFVNKNYDSLTQDFDVALLKLQAPATGDPVGLIDKQAETALLKPGTDLVVAGWGVTGTGAPSPALKQVTVPFVSSTTCKDPVSYEGRITDNMICAGFMQGGKDSCQGDSGGPLTAKDAGSTRVLAGIVSWGEGCARPGKFGVYARVATLGPWISGCMTDPNNCPAK